MSFIMSANLKPVCPHCGHKHSDSVSISTGTGVGINCRGCGKRYTASADRNDNVSYR